MGWLGSSRPKWLITIVAAVLISAACGGGGGGSISEQEARDVMPRMVLQADDVPEGLQRAGEQFTTNEELAEGAVGAPPSIEQIEAWGRILGYETDFQAAALPSAGPFVTGLNTAVSVYKTAEGTSASFADSAQQARDADWASFYTDLTEFETVEVARAVPADEILWLRLSGLRARVSGEGSVLVIDDQIAFRVGKARGFLRVLISEDGGTNRDLSLERVEALLRTQIQHTRDGLEAVE